MMVTRSPFSSTPTCPDRGDAWRPTSDVRPSRLGPERRQHGVRAAGDRILGDTESRGEEAGDEVVFPALDRPRPSRSRRRHRARLTAVEVRAQVTNRALVGDEREQEDVVVCAARPFHGHTQCLCRGAPCLDLGGRPRRESPSPASRPARWLTVSTPLRVANRIGPSHAVLEEAVGRRERRVAAEIDLDRRREPAEPEVSVRQTPPG